MENYKLELYSSKYDINDYKKIYNKIKENYKVYNFEKDFSEDSIGLIKDKDSNIIFCFEYYYAGIKPELLVYSEMNILLLGASHSVVYIDMETKRIKNIFSDVYSLFYQFLKIEDKIIVIFELEVYAIDFKGNIIWQNSFSDIVVEYSIENKKLIVKTYDNLKLCYLLENGKII